MRKDIDGALSNWDYKPETIQARIVSAGDRRQVLQMRLDMGVLQLEVVDRPDGTRPHGHATYFDYLQAKAAAAKVAGRNFKLSEEHCREADREFMQFYQRRICWLTLSEYRKAVEDADHTLAFMDLVRDHSPSEEFTEAHEQYRSFVLFHRIQAAAAAEAEDSEAEAAIDVLRKGSAELRELLEETDEEFEPESDPMLEQLQRLEEEIRNKHGVGETLQEQLDKAVADEQYETAAKLRDAIRRREMKSSDYKPSDAAGGA
ncbi:UvrB/UvrC motif-containing protein [soil metagenome]